MKRILAVTLLIFSSLSGKTQCDPSCGPNLVPNAGFEDVNQEVCEFEITSELFLDQSPVAGWIGAAESGGFSNLYTPDYFNPNCTSGNPFIGVDESAAVGFYTVTFPGDPSSEWFQVQLDEPLTAGVQYCISFSAFSYLENGSPGDGLDVAILADPIDQDVLADGSNPTGFAPAYSNPTGEFIPEEFTQYSFEYCANGGEQWLAFGNQNADETITEQPGAQSYVVIDNVNLSESCSQNAVDFEITASQLTIGCNDCSTLQAVDENGTVVNVEWSDGLGLGVSTVDVCPDETSTYTATFTSASCDGEEILVTEEITIEVDCDENPVVTLEGGTICPGDTFTIQAEVSGGTPEYTFQWEPEPLGDSSGPFIVAPDETTTYEVVVVDAAGATATAEATIVVSDETLNLNLPAELSLCDGPVTIDASGSGGTDYLWSDGSTEPTFTADVAGTYTVEVSNACSDETAEVVVTGCQDLTATLEGAVICFGESVDLEAEISGGSPPYSLLWNPGNVFGDVLTVSPNQNTTYTLLVTDAENATLEVSATVEVVSPDLSIDLGGDRFICPGDTLVLNADIGTDFQYVWNIGSSFPEIEITRGGTYIVSVETACSLLSDTVVITEALPDFTYSELVKACEGDEVEIGPAESERYQVTWSDGETVDRKTVSNEGVFEASLTTENCPRSIFIQVEVELLNCDCRVYVPNAFTPNGDGINDVFKVIPDCNIESFNLRIYNRWGNEVFSTDSPEAVWKGESNDVDFYSKGDLYTYIITVQPKNELFVPEPVVLRGSITMLR